jgi:serpin B
MNKLSAFLVLAIVYLPTKGISQKELVDANNDFSFRIHKSLKKDSSNFFISPFSLHLAFAIANEGARSSTREEIDKFLCLDNRVHSKNDYKKLINATLNLYDAEFTNCMEWYKSKKKGLRNTLLLANSAWINDRFEIHSKFKSDIEDQFKSTIFTFNKQNIFAANRNMNDWISSQTQDKITNAGQLNESTVMRLVNAIYFKGTWEIPFDQKKTKKKNFFRLDGEKSKIDFMQNQAYFKYFEDNAIQALSIPYLCDQFTMLILLPHERYGVIPLEDSLTSKTLNKIQSSSSRQEVIVSIPKFKIVTELSIIDQLKGMGYTLMFSDNADFSGMSKTSLKINEVIHKTTIEVSEEKTEAAAVSSIEMVVTGAGRGEFIPPPPPKIFNANHPFVFFILDNRTQSILFTGRFVQNKLVN